METNIFGLSNTAVNLEKFVNIKIPEEIQVADWFLFSIQILNNRKAIFTNEFSTYYRQHIHNVAHINDKTLTQLLNELKVKSIHYSHMSKYSKNYDTLKELISEFAFLNDMKTYEYFLNISLKKVEPSKAWWSLIKIKELEDFKNVSYKKL
jgi:hypothetical protein